MSAAMAAATLLENTSEGKQGLCFEQHLAASGVDTLNEQEGSVADDPAADALAEIQALHKRHGVPATWEDQSTLLHEQATCIAQKPKDVGQKVLSKMAKEKHEENASQRKGKRPVERELTAPETAENQLWQGLKDNGFVFATDGKDKFNGRFRRYLQRNANAEKVQEYHQASDSKKKRISQAMGSRGL